MRYPQRRAINIQARAPRGRSFARSFAALAILVGLTACNRGPEEVSGSIELGRTIRDTIAERRAPDPAPLQINRAFIQQFSQPHLEFYVENRDLTGYMGLCGTDATICPLTSQSGAPPTTAR